MSLVSITCFCGSSFELPTKKRKQLLTGFERFCSAYCLQKYLQSLPDKYEDPFDHCDIEERFLGDPHEYWDCALDMYFRSSYEAIAAKFFTAIGEPWKYEPCVIFLQGRKQYNPDFFLYRSNTFVEVKGAWAGSNKSKMRTCVQRGHNLILIPSYLVKSINEYLSRISV